MQFHSCFAWQSQHTEYKENNTNDKVTRANAATPYTPEKPLLPPRCGYIERLYVYLDMLR